MTTPKKVVKKKVDEKLISKINQLIKILTENPEISIFLNQVNNNWTNHEFEEYILKLLNNKVVRASNNYASIRTSLHLLLN